MKRSSQLKRKTPLRDGRRPLPTFSRRRRAERPERDAVREAVLARDGYRCRLKGMWACHGPNEAHHLKKASQGGAYTPETLVVLCSAHNADVEDWPLLAHSLGLVQRQGDSLADCWARLFKAGLSSAPEPGSAP